MTKLVVLTGDLQGTVFTLNKPVITLGRRADNDIALTTDMRVSRFHAQLQQRGSEWILEDLGSANGTFVGQRRIHGPTVLRPGDRFRLGRTWLALMSEPVHTSEAEARRRVQLEASPALVSAAQKVPAPESLVHSASLDAPRASLDAATASRWLDVLSHVSEALASTLNLAQLLDIIIDNVMAVMPADTGCIFLVDRKTGEFLPKAFRQRTPAAQEAPVIVSRHILEYAINERKALMTADAMHDARFDDSDSVHNLQLHSTLCAPLFHGEEALGAIFLESRSAPGAFSVQDLEMLRTIAGQAAMAIENARLYTDMRQALETLQQTQEQLLRSERLSTIGAITASIAHDMANIVTPLKPLLNLILQDHSQTQNEELVEAVHRQMDRLTALLERLLSFSKGELRLEAVQINELLPKTLSLIRSEIHHRNVEVVLQLDEQLPPVLGDAAQLDRVFLNICLNALEAMEEMPPEKERTLTITTQRDGEEIVISFADTGPGIPVERQEKLFEPLFTTKETGTGLGLYSCKRIIEEHHGTIEVDSIEGAGATFTVRLPARADAAPPQA